ncbi:N-acetylmuramyl-L-alanine amidase, negative regulator of AmpC, AmpD [Lacrimispora sphenoides]|nr:N-acetylmuramyl-L-alanine amidase, negative regulator of AmpC, AmpD [Lacrimispora sphenoides]
MTLKVMYVVTMISYLMNLFLLSLGIEMCVRNSSGNLADTSRDWHFEDAAVQKAIVPTKELMTKYNIPADLVIRHYDVTGKICPNPYVYNHTKYTWKAFKAALVTPAIYTLGWNHDKNGRWYANSKTTYYKSCCKSSMAINTVLIQMGTHSLAGM